MIIAKPFVKWVGGKTQLLEEVEKSLPKNFSEKERLMYVEPFVGGGAVLFWIMQKFPNIRRAVINDVNKELITTYRVVKLDVEPLISMLTIMQNEYLSRNKDSRKEYFLKKRELFNSKNLSDIETATLFIFLNKTCFNGLYRVNAKGEFNVPHGRYVNPKICDPDNLRAASLVLQKVKIQCGDFSETIKWASDDVLFYLDPPYRPITETSSFTSYSKNGFDDSEQIRLRDFCAELSNRGAIFIASNSDPQNTCSTNVFFDELYEDFNIKRVYASRMINSKADGRGKLTEIMISNV